MKFYDREKELNILLTNWEQTTERGRMTVLLKGENGKTGQITLTSADSDTELSGNKLVGTLAPTYLAEETAYGLSGNQFFLNNAGTINTNRAYLPASELSTGGNVKALTFIFETVDGIKTVEQVSAEEAAEIFNLAGQRLQKAQRGVNIINGKKVLVK